MITPRFRIEQDDEFITLFIETPYVKYSEGEMVIFDNTFTFYCKPYHLKLFFSGEVTEDGTESAVYSVEKSEFEIKVPKACKGENFDNLDMLTLLMTPRNEKPVKGQALIEVISSTSFDLTDDRPAESEVLLDVDPDDIDWSIEQTVSNDELVTDTTVKYGFNNMYSGVFTKVQEDLTELLDLQNPDKTAAVERRQLQQDHELVVFNSDHYIADLIEDDMILELLNSEETNTALCALLSAEMYSPEEINCMVGLPRKEYILDETEMKRSLLGLIDILYSYLYEMRSCCYDPSVESAYNIRKLSSTMSWLAEPVDLATMLKCCLRRALCCSLYRHWVLCMKVMEDLRKVLASGKLCVLKCLLHIMKLFNNAESFHIMNQVFITDYCVWLQSCDDKYLQSLSRSIKKIQLCKSDVDLEIPTIEQEYIDSTSESSSSSNSDESCDSSDDNDAVTDDNNTTITSKISVLTIS